MRTLTLLSILFAASTLTASVVQPIGAASQILIPAGGSAAGADGTFFRSDISIVNLATHDHTVSLQWLPQPGLTVPPPVTILIHALTGLRSADFVQEILSQTGLGAIVVTGTLSDGTTIDASAKLFVSSRIWTPQPGTNGTTSQDLVTVPTSTINTPLAAIFGVGGLDNPSQYRVNVGIVNLDPTKTQTFQISYTLASTAQVVTEVTLPPMSMQQVPAGTPFSPPQILIQNETAAATRSNLWTAYGSTVNNVTGDAWTEIAVVGTTP